MPCSECCECCETAVFPVCCTLHNCARSMQYEASQSGRVCSHAILADANSNDENCNSDLSISLSSLSRSLTRLFSSRPGRLLRFISRISSSSSISSCSISLHYNNTKLKHTCMLSIPSPSCMVCVGFHTVQSVRQGGRGGSELVSQMCMKGGRRFLYENTKRRHRREAGG